MWNDDDSDQDADLATHVYWKPEAIPGAPAGYQPGTTFTESRELEERFTLPALVPNAPAAFPAGTRAMPVPRRVLDTPAVPAPVFVPSAPQPQVFIPRPMHTQQRPQVARREVPRSRSRLGWVTIGFAAVCVLTGIAIGGAFSLAGQSTVAVAAPSTKPAKFTAPVEVTATPIVVPPSIPSIPSIPSGPAPAPILVVPPPPAAILPVAPAPVAPAPVAPAPVHHHHAAPAAAPRGILQISAKPPCQIIIDGNATGLTTPQRAIQLAPGSHDITFVNASEGIHLTTQVEVSLDHPTTLVRDFTD